LAYIAPGNLKDHNAAWKLLHGQTAVYTAEICRQLSFLVMIRQTAMLPPLARNNPPLIACIVLLALFVPIGILGWALRMRERRLSSRARARLWEQK
jgi:hypothetical protein